MTENASNSLVSIIIPLLNGVSRIETCLESVFAQNYPTDRMEIQLGAQTLAARTVALLSKLRFGIGGGRFRVGGQAGPKCGILRGLSQDLIYTCTKAKS